MSATSINPPYLLFVGDARDALAAKTAAGILYWRRDWCLGQVVWPGCGAQLDLPAMTVAEAAAAGARTLIVGVANAGGVIPAPWVATLTEALHAGMDVASGLHDRLDAIPALRDAAAATGKRLIDVRHPTRTFAVGTGEPRPGRRLLTVGTDCSVGKMYASLALVEEMQHRGVDAAFCATGQTGIFIAGDGISVDAVVADFVSGATEWLSPANDPDHWDIIEGQGSLYHPSFAGVSLGLLHGAQPDVLVMCHEPTRSHMRGLPSRALPSLTECIAANVEAARLTNPAVRCIGLAVNTRALAVGEAERYLDDTAAALGLPCVDPVRTSVAPLVDCIGL